VEAAIPSLVEAILLSVPNTVAPPSVRVGGMLGPEDRASLRSALDALVSSATLAFDSSSGAPMIRTGSDAVDWMATSFLPTVSQIALFSPSPSCKALERLGFLTASLMRELGTTFTGRIAQPILSAILGACKEERERSRLVVLYILAVLAILPSEELAKWMRATVADIALNKNGWTTGNFRAIKAALAIVCTKKGGSKHEAVLSVLTELVSNPNSKIRQYVATLFAAVTDSLGADDIAAKVLPSLQTLASDPDADVRSEDCSSLAVVFASAVADQPTVDKAALSLEALADDKAFKVRMAVCRSFGEVA
jgi:hypothetical protein